MKGRKKKLYTKPRLALKVNVIQVKDIDLFRDFECHPVCLVTTNSFNSTRTSKLRYRGTKWDEELKIKLPRKPTSEWVRIIIYDALPSSSASALELGDDGYSAQDVVENAASGSTGATSVISGGQEHTSGNSDLKLSRQRKYLYVGEAKLSIVDLFKDYHETENAQFVVPPTWYKIYDKRRHTSGNIDESCGQVELGFNLVTLQRQDRLSQAYNQWKSSLSANLRYQKTLKKSNIPVNESNTKLANGSTSDLEKSPETRYGDDEDDGCESYLDYSDEDAAGDFESEYELLAAFQSHDSDDVAFGPDGAGLSSMISALDEYEVVRPEEASALPSMSTLGVERSITGGTSGEIKDSTPYDALEDDPEEVSDTIDEYSEDDDDNNTADITIQKTGNRLTNLGKKRNRNRKFKQIYLSNWDKYKLFKKQHAAGVVFIEIQSIKGLPSYKAKVSRRRYDMDPFVVAVFGRRVFKTSWKKHTLNPVFNECAAFEVFPEETHFGFYFNVMDKDSFSYNDKVARCHLSWSEMMGPQHGKDDNWASIELPLEVTKENVGKQSPKLLLKMRFLPYACLRKFFWKNAVNMGTNLQQLDIAQLSFYLDRIGSFTTEEACDFFKHFQRSPWSGDCITKDELIEYLQTWNQTSGFKNFWKCPRCGKSCRPTRNTMRSKLVVENDLITHFAVCSFEQKYKLLKHSYVSSDFASKRWYSRILIKLTYGKYALGSNNANILVQDRDTGIILEEKISAHVKLGMRIIYNGKGKQSRNFRQLLRTLSMRQGRKFDDPSSVKQIESFIKYHSLNMSECEEAEYSTFNEFFYRKLKPGTRTPEGDTTKIFVSPADSRCTVFSSVHQSKEIWIKGSNFTLSRLTGNYSPEIFNDKTCGIAIFRLAPQDYHRFHSPCNGTIGKPISIDGEYYTVNPMAVRSSLDVFCENVRVIIPIISPEFGLLLCIPIGAMMVGSIMLTCKEGATITRGQELGYFKFGGSTVVVIMPSDKMFFDSDLSKNSVDGLETLVKVGMSVGHIPEINEHKRERVKLDSPEQIESVKRKISVKHENADILGRLSWQYRALEKFITKEYGEPEIVSEEIGSDHPNETYVAENSSSSTLPSSN